MIPSSTLIGSCFVISPTIDRVSVPSPIAFEKLMDTINGEGQSFHVPVFCVNFERHICTHITTSIKCYLHSLRHVCRLLIFHANQTGMYTAQLP